MNPFTPKVRAVVRREFMSRVKSKWFLFSTIGLPVLIVGLMALATLLAVRGAQDSGDEARALGVADPSGVVADLVVEELLSDSILASRASASSSSSETVSTTPSGNMI